MIQRGIFTTIVFLSSVCVLFSQSADQIASNKQNKTHLERFSTLQMIARKNEIEANESLQKNPNDAAALNKRGVAGIQLKKFNAAADDLKKAISINPDNAEFKANYGYVLAKSGNFNEAIAMQRSALKIDPENFLANHQLGRLLLSSGKKENLEESLIYFNKALQINPKQDEIRFDLIVVYRSLSDFAKASSQLGILENAKMSDFRLPYYRALLLTDRGDLREAIPNFQNALRINENFTFAWRDLGLTFLKLGQWDDAEKTFSELSKRAANSAEAAYFRALSLYNLGKTLEAEADVRRALQINAGFNEAQILLGIILASRGNANDEAEDILEQAVALNDKSFDAAFYLGRIRYTKKKYIEAVKSLKSAVLLNPKNAKARFFLGTVLEINGNSEEALGQYEELLKIEPESIYGQIGLGALLVKQGEIEEAITTLKRANELDTKNFEARWALGRAFMLAERFAEAAESLEKAVEIEPKRADAHYQLGLAYRRLGKNAEAAGEFEIVNQINKDFRTGSEP